MSRHFSACRCTSVRRLCSTWITLWIGPCPAAMRSARALSSDGSSQRTMSDDIRELLGRRWKGGARHLREAVAQALRRTHDQLQRERANGRVHGAGLQLDGKRLGVAEVHPVREMASWLDQRARKGGRGALPRISGSYIHDPRKAPSHDDRTAACDSRRIGRTARTGRRPEICAVRGCRCSGCAAGAIAEHAQLVAGHAQRTSPSAPARFSQARASASGRRRSRSASSLDIHLLWTRNSTFPSRLRTSHQCCRTGASHRASTCTTRAAHAPRAFVAKARHERVAVPRRPWREGALIRVLLGGWGGGTGAGARASSARRGLNSGMRRIRLPGRRTAEHRPSDIRPEALAHHPRVSLNQGAVLGRNLSGLPVADCRRGHPQQLRKPCPTARTPRRLIQRMNRQRIFGSWLVHFDRITLDVLSHQHHVLTRCVSNAAP